MKKLIKTKNDRLSIQQAFHNFLTLKKSEGRTQSTLNSDLKTAISKYLRKTGLCGQSEYLFPNVEGGLLHVDTINKRMEKLFAAAGVEFRGYHEFRRTDAAKTYAALGDIEQTRKLMMISAPRVLRRYADTDIEQLKECVQKLNFATQMKAPRPLRGEMRKGA